MNGISNTGKDRINAIVEDMFDNLSLQFLGNIPALQGKRLFISYERNLGLPQLFVQAMQNKMPTDTERDFLKSLLNSAHGYIESLKNKTKANLTERIDGLIREAKLRKTKVREFDIQDVVAEEMTKARASMLAIVESESTKFRNVGTMVDIAKVSTSLGDEDPTVFFVVIKDTSTCKECIRLHLMPDQTTPRLWKLSELKQGYHKRGEDSPSAFGLHPHCRCTLTYLSRGFGFDTKGKLKYQELGHDAYSEQK